MNRQVSWTLVILACGACVAPAAETPELRGVVDAVTVYRGQALVTRLVELPGPAGLREVVVTDLPEHVVPGSIHAESADGVEVRSVRYRVRPVMEDVREEVRKLDDQIREVQDKLQANQRYTELAGQQKAYLDKLEQFVAPTANVELTKGVLNAETLRELTTFLGDHRKNLAKEELQLSLEQRDLKEQLELLQRQRQELTGSSSRTAREAVVFLNVQADGGQLRLRYLVDKATWSPSYNIRTDADRSQVLVQCNGSIQQMSGEDWTDVAMTLSTATPSLVAKAPVLKPLTVALTRPAAQVAKGKAAPKDYRQVRQRLMAEQIMLDNTRNALIVTQQTEQQAEGQPLDPQAWNRALASNDADLNYKAGQLQNLDLAIRGSVKRRPTTRPKIDEGVTVTYQLAGRTSLPSRSDRQLIQIAAIAMQGDFYKVASPVLTSFVYEEAAVINEGDMVLLAGPVATYVAGQFVGHGEIPTVAIGEGFTVGFGIDSSLRVSRELIEKEEAIQGGNRVVDFTYRLALENFAGEPATVRLFDRLPQAKDTDVKLSLVSPGLELSEDAAYRQTDHKKGILRWEVEVPAHAVGPQAKAFEYQFRLEYDKELTIDGLASAAPPAVTP